MNIESKIFIAIIFGSFIIGGFAYFAVSNKALVLQNNETRLTGHDRQTDYDVSMPILGPSVEPVAGCLANDNTIVTKVIDGDTITVEGGEHIRLLGIDADEKDYPCYEPAKIRLEELVLNKKVKLEKDKTDTDRYKRCLRTVFIKNQNIGLELVKEGLAIARFYEPDVKYKNEIANVEKQAIENKIGCKWNSK